MVGGGAPIVVQSMTNTDTADVEATVILLDLVGLIKLSALGAINNQFIRGCHHGFNFTVTVHIADSQTVNQVLEPGAAPEFLKLGLLVAPRHDKRRAFAFGTAAPFYQLFRMGLQVILGCRFSSCFGRRCCLLGDFSLPPEVIERMTRGLK